MKLRNPLKSLTWNSLFRSSRGRRRHRPSYAPVNVAAEVLEVRALLTTANVAAAVVGTALTLSSDNNGNHSVNVYRLDATHVEIDANAVGTTINGGASAVFALSSVSGITVNVGNGYDTYSIFSKSGNLALNVGAGGVLFNGVGGTGDNLEVFNNSTNAMTILGNVTVQGSTFGSSLTESGSSASFFDLDTESGGSLTVGGSVSASEKGTGSGSQNNSIFTNGAGTLCVAGSVTESLTQTSSGYQENDVDTDGAGNLTIGLGVTQCAMAGTNEGFNKIFTHSGTSGNVSIGGSVAQTATNVSFVENEVFADSTGNVTVKGSIIETATSTGGSNDAENFVDTDSLGNVAVAGAVSQTASSAFFVENEVYNETSSGNVTIGAQIAQTASGAASQGANNYVFNDGSGTLMVGLSITQNATTTSGEVGDYVFDESTGGLNVGPGGITINESNSAATGNGFNQVYSQSSGILSTTGLIIINAANSTAASFNTVNSVDTKGSSSGTLSTLGVVIIDSGSEMQSNEVFSDGAAIAIGSVGVTIIGSGSGFHDNEIDTDANGSPITIAGSVTVIDTGTGHSTFRIEANHTNSPITICGSVVYDNADTVGRSLVQIFGSINNSNSVLTIKGSLVLTLAQTSGTASDNQSFADNEVDLGENEGTTGLGYGTVVNGVTIITGSNGQDKIFIRQSQLALGAVINTMGSPTPGSSLHDELEIDGSLFGSTVLVTMTGPNAEIDINNGNSNQATVFAGLFEAIMLGSNSKIFVADGSGVGFSAVKFDAAAIAVGTPGVGDTFTYHTANVTGSIIPIGFTLVAL
jgi:hypothetical protein